jgi:hypothetical protein
MNVGCENVPSSKQYKGSLACIVLVISVEIVLDEKRNPMHGTSSSFRLPFLVHSAGDGESIGIYFADGVEVSNT